MKELVASDKSYQAGTKVGLVSGAKIVDILKKNSDMDLEKYRKRYVGIPVSQSVSLTESHARRGSGVRRHRIDAYTVIITKHLAQDGHNQNHGKARQHRGP